MNIMVLTKILEDFGGKVIFDDDDERWAQVLSRNALSYFIFLKSNEKSFLRELLTNNSFTSNLQRLANKIIEINAQLERQKGVRSAESIHQACAGLCLITLVLQYAAENLTSTAVLV